MNKADPLLCWSCLYKYPKGSVIAAGYIDMGSSHNSVLLVGPDGEKDVYVKYHLVPGGETTWQKAGARPYGAIHIKSLNVNVAGRICYDNDFPNGNRKAAQHGADILIAPSADDGNIAERHAMMHVMRAVENAVPLIRPTLGGVSLIADPKGNITSWKQVSKPGDIAYLVDDLSVVKTKTLYGRFGNWILIVAGLILTAAVIKIFVAGHKRNAKADEILQSRKI